MLSSEEALAAALRWRGDQLRYTVERAGFWMQPPSHFGSSAGSGALREPGMSSAAPAPSASEQLAPASGFVLLCGIAVPCRRPSAVTAAAAHGRSSFVQTETVSRNLEAAALVLCQQQPLLLEGPPGETCAACNLLHAFYHSESSMGILVQVGFQK